MRALRQRGGSVGLEASRTVTFTIHLERPERGWQRDLMRWVGIHHGEGYSQGRRGVTLHRVSEYGLGMIEADLHHLVKQVQKDNETANPGR